VIFQDSSKTRKQLIESETQ